jgi:hypothetical protein
MNDKQLSNDDKKELRRFISNQAWRLTKMLVIGFFVCFLFFTFVVMPMDNISPAFISHRTRSALEEAQEKGIIAFAFEVLKFCSRGIVIGVGIFCWNTWNTLKKNSASSVEK